MKVKTLHIVLFVILFAVVLSIVASPSEVVPYAPSTLFSNMYRYEGFSEGISAEQAFSESKVTEEIKPDANGQGTNKPPGPPNGGGVEGMKPGKNGQGTMKLPSLPTFGFNGPKKTKEGLTVLEGIGKKSQQDDKKKSKKVEGFALQPAPYASNPTLDIYSTVNASPSCFNRSSGLSNSKGGLCLEGDSLRLLTTRGGNSTGKNGYVSRQK